MSLTRPARSLPSPTGADARPHRGSPSPEPLAQIALNLAAEPSLWLPLLRFDPDQRWYTRLTRGDGWEAWLLSWLPGQGTDLHDHGGSRGAFTVLSGALQELTHSPTETDPSRLTERMLPSGQVRAFGADHIHQVIGLGPTAAVSLHVYDPALTVMNRYHLDAERGPVIVETDRAGTAW